eukprot:scaffold4761_cov205-Amphora_coffeaeformis.AAC.6
MSLLHSPRQPTRFSWHDKKYRRPWPKQQQTVDRHLPRRSKQASKQATTHPATTIGAILYNPIPPRLTPSFEAPDILQKILPRSFSSFGWRTNPAAHSTIIQAAVFHETQISQKKTYYVTCTVRYFPGGQAVSRCLYLDHHDGPDTPRLYCGRGSHGACPRTL